MRNAAKIGPVPLFRVGVVVIGGIALVVGVVYGRDLSGRREAVRREAVEVRAGAGSVAELRRNLIGRGYEVYGGERTFLVARETRAVGGEGKRFDVCAIARTGGPGGMSRVFHPTIVVRFCGDSGEALDRIEVETSGGSYTESLWTRR